MILDILRNSDSKVLHQLLLDVSEKWMNSSVGPVVIGRFMLPSSHKSSPPTGMFRMQYGARTWITGGHGIGFHNQKIKPEYEFMLEEDAKNLKKNDWHLLSCSLLGKSLFSKQKKTEQPVEMCLFIENDEVTFSVRLVGGEKDTQLKVSADGFKSICQPRTVWFQSYGYHTPVPQMLPSDLLQVPQEPNLTSLSKQIAWWYNTPLMSGGEAEDILGKLFLSIRKCLSELGNQVVVAFSAQRFNDANGDDFWNAAYVDGKAWENGTFFVNTATVISKTPSELNEAIGLIEQIKECGVRHWFSTYLGNNVTDPDCMVLSLDNRGLLVAFSSSVDSGGPVYRVDSTTGLPSFIGVTPRLDWRFSDYWISGEPEAVNSNDVNPILSVMQIEDWVAYAGQYQLTQESEAFLNCDESFYDEDFPELYNIKI